MIAEIEETLRRALENDCETGLDDTDVQNVLNTVVPLVADRPITVTQDRDWQGVTLWLGDSIPVHIDDSMSDLRQYIYQPIQRAVTIARLRAIADLLDNTEADQ